MKENLAQTTAAEPKPNLAGILKIAFVVLFVVLVFLLTQSMVEHRFFEGQRVHDNGSVGQ
jgi:hypothetical protein